MLKMYFGLALIGTALQATSVSADSAASGWELTQFHPQMFQMAIATNKKTGRKMTVVRVTDGSVMALVPSTELWERMKQSPDDRS